jgi:hypothetical protein
VGAYQQVEEFSGRRELRFAGGFLGRLDGHLYRKVLSKPVVNAFFLTGIDNSLPPDITSPFIIFRNDVRVAGQDGYDRILSKPTAVVRIVDYLAILHAPIVAEILLL